MLYYRQNFRDQRDKVDETQRGEDQRQTQKLFDYEELLQGHILQ